jgi:ATP-dependent DNA helicase RecG
MLLLQKELDKSIDIIFPKYFKGLIDYEGIQRRENYMLTRGIVRELLLNAIYHKDYGSDI